MQEQKYDKHKMMQELRFDAIMDDGKKSNFQKYKNLVVGNGHVLQLFRYEFLTFFFGSLPSGVGLFLRRIFYQGLFESLGKGAIIGSNVTLRQPKRISVGAKTIVDDFSVLSVRGSYMTKISIGKKVLIGRGAHLRVKEGVINLGDFSRIGPFSFIGTTQSITIGKHFTTGPLCIIGLLNKSNDDPQIPNTSRISQEKGGVIIEDNVALGGSVIVLDGIKIGSNSLIGAGTVVTKDIPENSVAYGVPAKVTGKRFE